MQKIVQLSPYPTRLGQKPGPSRQKPHNHGLWGMCAHEPTLTSSRANRLKTRGNPPCSHPEHELFYTPKSNQKPIFVHIMNDRGVGRHTPPEAPDLNSSTPGRYGDMPTGFRLKARAWEKNRIFLRGFAQMAAGTGAPSPFHIFGVRWSYSPSSLLGTGGWVSGLLRSRYWATSSKPRPRAI